VPKLNFWGAIENEMIAAVVTLLEVTVLLFATTRALVSIVNPKVQGAFYYVFVLLPLAIVLPAFVARADAKAASAKIHDD
jgi:hypothetical protein